MTSHQGACRQRQLSIMPLQKTGHRRRHFCTCTPCRESGDAVESVDSDGQARKGLWVTDTTIKAHSLAEQRSLIVEKMSKLSIPEGAPEETDTSEDSDTVLQPSTSQVPRGVADQSLGAEDQHPQSSHSCDVYDTSNVFLLIQIYNS